MQTLARDVAAEPWGDLGHKEAQAVGGDFVRQRPEAEGGDQAANSEIVDFGDRLGDAKPASRK